MFTLALVICLVTIILSLFLLSTKKFDYWKKKNVPHLKPTPLLGNYADYILLKRSYGEVVQEMCRKFPKTPYFGTYYGTEPALVIQDPELIKLIVAKDFVCFNGREVSNHTHKENITRTLFFSYGDRWKILRQGMSPIFTSSKIKNMFPLVQKCTIMLEEMLERETKRSAVLDARKIISRYTMDFICSSGFGIEVNTMGNNVENNSFFKIGELIFDSSKLRGFLLVTRAIWPSIFYALGFNVFPKQVYQFFHKVIVNVFEVRNYKPSGRNDFIDISLNLKEKGAVTIESLTKSGETTSLEVDVEFLVLQCLTYFGAGFETSATILSYALYELAKDKECYKRAVEEVDEYLSKHDGKVECDCTTELTFLNAVVDETMRLYPVLMVLTRELLTSSYTFPDGLRLDKGLRVHIPVFHLHRSPEYFPDPESFKPDRFLPKNKINIKPYTYLPFGEGPRICIGMRIAKMVILPGLVTILKSYTVELAEGMPKTIQFDPCTIITTSVHGIKLKFNRRYKSGL